MDGHVSSYFLIVFGSNLYICYGPIHNLTGFEAGRRLWSRSTGFEAGQPASKPVDPIYDWIDLLTHFETERSAGTVAESENDATQRESIRAVAITLQSWCLIKLNRGLLLRNFDLALEAVGNGAFAEIVGEWLETTEYVLYSSDSSPASCWIKLSCLPSAL